MIEWKEYNEPEKVDTTKMFLVTNGNYIAVAGLDYDKTNGYAWWDKAGFMLAGVTHYAEFNLPNERR